MTKNELLKHIDSSLLPLGFKRKDTVWYKEGADAIVLFSLHKSRFGEIYFATLGALFKDLSKETTPKINKAHVNFRCENLGETTENYLDLEKNIDDAERKNKIDALLKKSILLLENMQKVGEFKGLLNKFNPRLFMIKLPAQQYLGINVE